MSFGLLLSEWQKLRIGRWSATTIGLSFPVALLGIWGLAVANRDLLETGATTVEAATAESARYWFTMHLFTSILGALYITREYSTGAIGRSVLLSQRRSHVIYGKLIAVVASVACLAALVAVLAVLTPRFAISSPFQAAWTRDATLSVIGVCFAMVAAAVWGLMLGFLIRSSAAVIGVLLVTTLIVDEVIFALSPMIGKYSFTLSLGAAFRDAREDLLSPLMGYAVACVWLIVATGLVHWSFNRRDIL